jgi:predicted ATPase
MISRLHFENFKSLAHVDIALERLTVLVGGNGSGKSSVLEATHLLSQMGLHERESPWLRLRWMFEGARHPRRLITSPGNGTIRLSMSQVQGDTLSLSIFVSEPQDSDLEHQLQRKFELSVHGQPGQPELTATIQSGDESKHPFDVITHPRVRAFTPVVYLHLDASRMSETSVVEEETPRLKANGHGLASSLAYLAGAAPEVLETITTDLAQVVPGVRRIRTFRERVQDRPMEQLNIDGQLIWRPVNRTRVGDRFAIEFDKIGNVPADLLSEGTVLALGLITKLHEPGAVRLLLLDDIDRGLHIAAQARLIDVLRKLLDARPELQIVCTTHSPYLLSRCAPEEVRVMALDADRHTRVRPLVEHPRFGEVRHGFQTGEIWASFGEDWVIGDTPGA